MNSQIKLSKKNSINKFDFPAIFRKFEKKTVENSRQNSIRTDATRFISFL